MADAKAKMKPPYLPFITFRSFMESLHVTALPSFIDKSLMRQLSGGVQSHMMIALRFLKLVDGPKDAVTDQMEKLYAAFGNPDAWIAELRAVLTSAYEPIIGTLDVAKLSDKQLDDAFRAGAGLEGVVLERATRFYVAAFKDAKVNVSPHLLNRKRRAPGKRPPKPATRSGGEEVPAGSTNGKPGEEAGEKKTTGETPTGTIDFPLYFKGKTPGMIRVPKELTADDVKSIQLTVNVITAYASQ